MSEGTDWLQKHYAEMKRLVLLNEFYRQGYELQGRLQQLNELEWLERAYRRPNE